MTTLLDAALAYAARGWPVFPCAPGSKVPAIKGGRGVLDATTDPAQIHAWWDEHPDWNVAIATGTPGPDVLDVDVKPDGNGWPALASITSAGLAVGAGQTVLTPGGGAHLYFTGTSQRNGSIRGHHIDYRGAGGYVVAPPSTVDGKPYQATGSDTPASNVADWGAVRALLDPPPDPAVFQQPAREQLTPAGDRPGDDWAAHTTWEQLLIPHGWRKVRDLGGGRACWCRPGKTGPFTSATTRDDGGLYVFSTSTEFDPEVPYSKFGALAVLEYGGDHTAAAAQLRREGFGASAPMLTLAPTMQPASDGEQPSGILARYPPVDWQQLWDDTPDDEEWILEPLLAAGRSIALYSPPKAGKSLLMLEVVAALVTGRPVLGQPGGKPRKVLYVDLENSRRDLRDRLISLGYKPADLTGLVYLSFPSLPMLDSPHGGAEIVELAMAHEVDVVVIDTVSRVISGKENDADTFADLYRYAMAPLKGKGISVARLDHAGKDLGRGQRGSSAKNADVDAVWTLSAAQSRVTLRCEMSRTVLPVMGLSLQRQNDPLRHVLTTTGEAAASDVQMIAARLDSLGLDVDISKREAMTALRANGEGRTDALVLRAVNYRKERFSPSTADYAAASGSGLSEPPSQNGSSGVVLASQNHSEPPSPVQQGEWFSPGSTRSGEPENHLAAPAVKPICHHCGERHPPGPCFQAAS